MKERTLPNEDDRRIASVSNKRFLLSVSFLIFCSSLPFFVFPNVFLIDSRSKLRSWAYSLRFRAFSRLYGPTSSRERRGAGFVALRRCDFLGSEHEQLGLQRRGAKEGAPRRCRLFFSRISFNLLLFRSQLLLCTCNDNKTTNYHIFLIFMQLSRSFNHLKHIYLTHYQIPPHLNSCQSSSKI